jgi:hypothetical protein
MDNLDIITLAEAGQLLGLAGSTLRNQVRAGRLRARLIGKTWVTTRDEVERYRIESLGQPGRPRQLHHKEDAYATLMRTLEGLVFRLDEREVASAGIADLRFEDLERANATLRLWAPEKVIEAARVASDACADLVEAFPAAGQDSAPFRAKVHLTYAAVDALRQAIRKDLGITD